MAAVAAVCGLGAPVLPLRSAEKQARAQLLCVPRCKGGVRMAAGDVVGGTNFLIAGALAIGVIGSAIPIFYLRKDTCPECDGAGFIRAGSSGVLSANSQSRGKELVCPTCNGLGKLNQVDKKQGAVGNVNLRKDPPTKKGR
eukprot:jgi/Chlat1/4126/Chrsp269S03962